MMRFRPLILTLTLLIPALTVPALPPGPGDEGYLAVLTAAGDGMHAGEVVELERPVGEGRFQVCVPRGSRSAVVPAQSLRKLLLTADSSKFDLTQTLIASMLFPDLQPDSSAYLALARKFAPGERTDAVARVPLALQKLEAFLIRAGRLSSASSASAVRRRSQNAADPFSPGYGNSRTVSKEDLELQALETEVEELYAQIFEQARVDAANGGDFYLAFLIAEIGGGACLEAARALYRNFPHNAQALQKAVTEDRKALVAEYRDKAAEWRRSSLRIAAYGDLYPEETGLWNESLPLDYREFRQQILTAFQARLQLEELSALAEPQAWGKRYLDQNGFLPFPEGQESLTPEYDRTFDALCAREANRRNQPAAPALPGTAASTGVQVP